MINSISSCPSLPQSRHTALNTKQTNQNLQFGTLKFVPKAGCCDEAERFIKNFAVERLHLHELTPKKVATESGDIYTATFTDEVFLDSGAKYLNRIEKSVKEYLDPLIPFDSKDKTTRILEIERVPYKEQ